MNIPFRKSSTTSKPVSINVNSSDNVAVASITLPDGTVVNSSTASFVVSQNGEYTFIVTDVAGNTTKKAVTITNIVPFAIYYTRSTTAMTSGPVIITVASSDPDSVASIKLPDGSVVAKPTTTYTVSQNGNYTFVVTDTDGNTTTIIAAVSNIIQG